MSSVGEGSKNSGPTSYLRTLDPLDAFAAMAVIMRFFDPEQQPVGKANKLPKAVHEPMYAKWIIGGGVALVAAAILTVVLREHLPPTMPGLYLGLGGLCVVIAGIIYAKFGAEPVEPEPTPEEKLKKIAEVEIAKQIVHFWKIADEAFGETTFYGRRAHLVGIGRKEWYALREVPIVAVKNDRIYAGIVHLVSIDLKETFIEIRQMGLHLMTGLPSNLSNSRYRLSDVMIASHEERKRPSEHKINLAAELVVEIGGLDTKNNKNNHEVQTNIAQMKVKLSELAHNFEEPAGNTFTLTFRGGERLQLVIADCDHPDNKSGVGYPISGEANLAAAVIMWDSIAKWQRVKPGRIFINYRREEMYYASRIHATLSQEFDKEELFFDVENILPGVDFVNALHDHLAVCDVFLAIIGPRWLNARDDSGHRRIENTGDFVAIEIAAAISRNVTIIPILLDGARMPKEEDLPDQMKPLARRQAIEVRSAQYDTDIQCVIDGIIRAGQ